MTIPDGHTIIEFTPAAGDCFALTVEAIAERELSLDVTMRDGTVHTDLIAQGVAADDNGDDYLIGIHVDHGSKILLPHRLRLGDVAHILVEV